LAADSTRIPQVRAVIVRAALKVFAGYPRPIRQRLESLLPEDLLAMRDDLNLAWAPIEFHLALIDASHECLDPAAFRKFHRDITLNYLDMPLLKGVLETCIRIFGLDPRSILRWAPRAWGILFRNCGTLEHDPSSTKEETRLQLNDFPRRPFSSGNFPLALAAAFEAAFTVTRTAGFIEVTSIDLTHGAADFVARHM